MKSILRVAFVVVAFTTAGCVSDAEFGQVGALRRPPSPA